MMMCNHYHLPLLLVLVGFASAAKDNDYYYPGFVNPNTEYKMYWKDSINVLQDLDQFDSLYIRYHNCVWSKYGTRYGNGEDYDEDDDEEDEADNGCGGWGGEYYWYMGRTQCFKANAAYSLYGVLKGDDPKMKGGSYCHQDSYINSFFTTFGAESFAGPLGLGVDTANSYCTSSGGNGENRNSGDRNDDQYKDAQADDDYVGDDYVFYDYDDFTSYGTGCAADGDFVIDSYNGAFCHGTNYNSTLNTLDSFNEALRSFECTQIYSAKDYSNNNNKDRRLEQEDYEFENMAAVQILSFSKSCSLSQYPHACPDPYGKKRLFAKNIQHALSYKTGENRDINARLVKASSWICFVAALIVMAAAYYLHQEHEADRARGFRRWRRKNKKQQQSKDPEAGNGKQVYNEGIKNSFSTGASSMVSAKESKSSKESKGSKGSKMRFPKFKFPKLRGQPRISSEDLDIPDDGTEISLADYAISSYDVATTQPKTEPTAESEATVQPNTDISHAPTDEMSASPEPTKLVEGIPLAPESPSRNKKSFWNNSWPIRPLSPKRRRPSTSPPQEGSTSTASTVGEQNTPPDNHDSFVMLSDHPVEAALAGQHAHEKTHNRDLMVPTLSGNVSDEENPPGETTTWTKCILDAIRVEPSKEDNKPKDQGQEETEDYFVDEDMADSKPRSKRGSFFKLPKATRDTNISMGGIQESRNENLIAPTPSIHVPDEENPPEETTRSKKSDVDAVLAEPTKEEENDSKEKGQETEDYFVDEDMANSKPRSKRGSFFKLPKVMRDVTRDISMGGIQESRNENLIASTHSIHVPDEQNHPGETTRSNKNGADAVLAEPTEEEEINAKEKGQETDVYFVDEDMANSKPRSKRGSFFKLPKAKKDVTRNISIGGDKKKDDAHKLKRSLFSKVKPSMPEEIAVAANSSSATKEPEPEPPKPRKPKSNRELTDIIKILPSSTTASPPSSARALNKNVQRIDENGFPVAQEAVQKIDQDGFPV